MQIKDGQIDTVQCEEEYLFITPLPPFGTAPGAEANTDGHPSFPPADRMGSV